MDENKDIKNRIIRIKLIDGTQINGQVNIDKGSAGYDRLSDLLLDIKEEFLVISEATSYQPKLAEPHKHEVMFLNKRHILWATPESWQQ